MKKLSTLALLGAIFLAPSMASANYGCNTCAPEPACAPCAAPVCMQPVCQVKTCICCPVIKGFLDC